MNKIFISLVCFVFLMSLSGSVGAATYTVCSSGCDYTSIQAAVNAASNGDTISVAAGTYSENVDVNKSVNLVGAGADVTIVNASNSSDHVFYVTANSVNISGFTVTGATGGAGIYLNNANYTNISNNAVSNNGDGIWLENIDYVYIINNIVHDNTGAGGIDNDGIRANINVNNVWIKNNVVFNNGYGIDLYTESGTTIFNNFTIINNYVYSHEEDGLYIEYLTNSTIANNNVSNNSYGGISLYSSSNNNTITNNTANSNSDTGIYLGDSSNNTLTGNAMSANTYNFWIEGEYNNTIDTSNTVDGKSIYYLVGVSDMVIDSSTGAGYVGIVNGVNVTVKDLTLAKNGVGVLFANTSNSSVLNVTASNNDVGIRVESSSNNTIANNNASKNSEGILILSSSSNTIANNNASNNGLGIPLGSSSSNTIIGNIAKSNSYGIFLFSSSNYNNITDNNVSNSSSEGIYLYYSSNNNTLTNNTASNNNNGISLGYSSNNTIIGNTANSNNYGIYFYREANYNTIYNNYYNNTNNFYFSGTIYPNDWNTTKTPGMNIVGGPYLGGNFWAKPDGTGFSEICGADSDGDGICDSSYTLASGNVDYLPLTIAGGGGGGAIPISSCTTITSPGVYVLNQSITDSSNSTCIRIESSDVILDGAGYTIDGTDTFRTYGVYVYSATARTNVIVKNLVVTDWHYGIYYLNARNGNIANNTASNNTYGIYLDSSSSNTLTNNTALNNNVGIFLDSSSNNIITNNTASNNKLGILLGSSSNNTVTNNIANLNSDGIYIRTSSNYNTISNNTASNNGYGIHLWTSSNYNTLTNNTASNNSYGIYIRYSSSNILTNNNANSNNNDGIFLGDSSNNSITDNNANNNSINGIFLRSSSSNTLTGNDMSANRYNFDVIGTSISDYVQTIDTTNTVNGKPIYYLVGVSDMVIDPSTNAGYVGIVNSVNITVRDLILTKNGHGVLFINTSNSSVLNVNASNNQYGIGLWSSSCNNILTDNAASNNSYGISIFGSSNNTIADNAVNSNNYGIYLSGSSQNNDINNNLIDNSRTSGFYFYDMTTYYNTINDNTVNGDIYYHLVNEESIVLENVISIAERPSNLGWVSVINSTNVTLRNLTLANNTGYNGLFLYQTTNSNISNVTSYSNINGIYLASSLNNIISGSNANSNKGSGINLYRSSSNIITSNTASNNSKGIRLTYSRNNTLANNTVNSNNGAGIWLYWSSNYNTISNNTANLNNGTGIYLKDSNNNLIYNNFFNNTNNFDLSTYSSSWNTTKTPGTNIVVGPHLGGNFWAYPNGNGFSETCDDADRDGICDSSYNLASGNVDYLPLSTSPEDVTTIVTQRLDYRFNITWTIPPDPDLEEFNIYQRLNDNSSTDTLIDTVPANYTQPYVAGPGYDDGNLYQYMVTPVNTSGSEGSGAYAPKGGPASPIPFAPLGTLLTLGSGLAAYGWYRRKVI